MLEEKSPPKSTYLGVSTDLLNQLLKKKSAEITVVLFKLDPDWKFNGKSKSGGEIWENKRFDQQLLKLSNGEIVYLDYSDHYMDNYNFLQKHGTDRNEINDLGVITFGYQNRFAQWKKLNENGKIGSILNLNDLSDFGN